MRLPSWLSRRSPAPPPPSFSRTATPVVGVAYSAKRTTPPAPARPVHPAGAPPARLPSGETFRFAAIMQILNSPGPRLANARKAIIGFHDMLRDRNSCPNLANEIVARTVGLYRETNYLGERLRTFVSGAELKLVERNVRSFISLLGDPMAQLPRDVRLPMQHDEPYARFLAGLFALARGRYDSALEHFTRAASSLNAREFSAWGVNPETILRSLQQGLNDQAVMSLGRLFRQLAESLPAAEDTPAPALDLTRPVHLTPLTQPVWTTLRPGRAAADPSRKPPK